MAHRQNTKVKLNIMQWNAQSVRPKLTSFMELLRQEQIHVCVVSETWLEPNSPLNVNGYTLYRQDRYDSYGGVAVLVHNSVKSQQKRLRIVNTDIELLCVELFNCSPVEYIICMYCPPRILVNKNDWESLLSAFTSNTLILGDLNAHHGSWSNRTNQRGTLLFDTMVNSNYVVLNDGSNTRIRLVNGNLQQSSPDVSLATLDISLQWNWVVLNETLGSDHLVIKLSSNYLQTTQPIVKRNFRKADWLGYSEFLKSTLQCFQVTSDIQESYDKFIHALYAAADAHIPIIKYSQNPSSNFKPKPYWNPSLSQAVAQRRLALTRFRRNPTPNNLNFLKNKISIAQREIRKAKIQGYQEAWSSIDQSTSSGDMWRKMQWLKGHKAPRRHATPSEAEHLLNSLTPDYSIPPSPIFSNQNSTLEVPISMQELEKCIKSKDTSPGYDDISYSMIKKMPLVGKLILLSLFNNILNFGFVPQQWRNICIVPIPKIGSGSSDITSWRPISLISCICKIFHYILYRRIEWYVEKNNLFSKNVVGFRRCQSCLDSLSCLITRIQTGFSERSSTVACFLDVESAYNTVNNIALLSVLDEIQIGPKICLYLWNFLRERSLKIKIKDRYISRLTGSGLAQGDPLSPLLFNIVTINICKQLEKDIFISQYADDFVIYSNCNSIQEGQQTMLNAIHKINSLLQKIGLEISPNKTKICIFKRGFRKETVNIKINGITMEVVDNVRYLGLWLDRGLRWGKHINEVKERLLKFIKIFKVLVGPGWGVHPVHLRHLYIALIRSRIDYASFLYDTSCTTHLVKLDKIQNICLRIIGGFIKTTPIHTMESELFLPPLAIRRRFLAGKFWLKARSLTDSTIIELLHSLSRLCTTLYWRNKKHPLLVKVHSFLRHKNIHSSKQLEMFSFDTWMTNIKLDQIIKPEICVLDKPKRCYNPHTLKMQCCQFLNEQYSSFYQIYTDGSKDDKSRGAAFLDIQTNVHMQFNVTAEVSVMQLELIAIAEALSYIESISEEHDRFVIFTDSKSSLMHLTRCTTVFRGLPLGYSIVKNILRLCLNTNKIVTIQWVPSHIGLQGNEEVDRLAKEATSHGEHYHHVPWYTDLLGDLKEHCIDLWSEYFNERSLSKGIWYKTIQPTLPKSMWFNGTDMCRQEITLALRLRSGHIPLNSFAFMMRKVESPNCELCGVIEDALHVLEECRRVEAQRKAQFNKGMNVGFYNSLLASPVSDEARRLYKLVRVAIRLRNNNVNI